ncbi:AdipoR/hemeolysin-III-related [Sesbania bispinosa]|nr:AdipoR/hemeolysin-III-related [Sesbania bispinosa]
MAKEINGSDQADSKEFPDSHLRHILEPSIFPWLREYVAETIPRWPCPGHYYPSCSLTFAPRIRVSLFLSMSFSGVIPLVHALVSNWGHPQILVALGYELVMGILYATGAVFYITRIPERWMPGAFDIAGHSHQIFHVFVVLGALAHSIATLVIMDFRQGSSTCAF